MVCINQISSFVIFCYSMLADAKMTNDDGIMDRYKIKTGIIYYNSSHNIHPVNKSTTLYFDEYGKKEVVTIESMIVDTKILQQIVKLGDIQYMMMDSVQCIKANRKKKFSMDNLDIDLLNDQSVKDYGIKNEGETFFLGKKCDKYTINGQEGRIRGEVLYWQNIPLRIVLNKNGIQETTEAYKIVTDQIIPDKIFDLPKTQEIIDMTSIDNN